ncbi:E3.5.4.3 [Acanthosepion pharaonis]|uniref:E3.5.4.3 n=1 Tax=Acanthosepion pharaonis TaxID=158019 RepID=A0A812D6D0_ACAPH|nr:E3.5.4.3 [Sepia pharaonis]
MVFDQIVCVYILSLKDIQKSHFLIYTSPSHNTSFLAEKFHLFSRYSNSRKLQTDESDKLKEMEWKDISVFIGCFAHSTWTTALEISPNMVIGVYNGKILFIENKENLPKLIKEYNLLKERIRYLEDREILIPGFVDCHNHASQFLNSGVEKFEDVQFAKDAYIAAVSTFVKNGTTTACYFATIHTDASLLLCDIAEKIGQRAYVGKVCMDQNEGSSYKENTKESLQETERFIETVQKRKYRLITPVVTPRFALSCTEKLMKGLAQIADKYDLPIQTHINENKKEIAEVEKRFPNKTYAETYDAMGLLKNKTILAHNIHCPHQDIKLIKKKESSVCHCPNSNTNLQSGMFWARQHLDADIKLGLGTGEYLQDL